MAGIRHTGSFLFVESDMPPPPGPVLTYIDPFLTVSLLYPFLSFLIAQLLAQTSCPLVGSLPRVFHPHGTLFPFLKNKTKQKPNIRGLRDFLKIFSPSFTEI